MSQGFSGVEDLMGALHLKVQEAQEAVRYQMEQHLARLFVAQLGLTVEQARGMIAAAQVLADFVAAHQEELDGPEPGEAMEALGAWTKAGGVAHTPWGRIYGGRTDEG